MKRWMSGALLTLVTGLTACGGEAFEYDSASYFPEDWETSYTKLETLDCEQSSTHGGEYVQVWVNDTAAPSYDAAGATAEEGAVIIKPQYTDDACSELSAITVMRKAASGWEWQRVEADGAVAFSGENSTCSDCHSACNDFRCASE